MAKSVQLSDEAYATLASLKREGESFSDVVRRLARARKEPTALLRLPGTRADFDDAREAMRRADQRKARAQRRT